jgi:hypothetical protein
MGIRMKRVVSVSISNRTTKTDILNNVMENHT